MQFRRRRRRRRRNRSRSPRRGEERRGDWKRSGLEV
jgi:hypothetical protein